MPESKLKPQNALNALVLAGGRGTRFWPVSRRERPKQLLLFDGERSLLRRTVDRLSPLVESDRIWICTTEALRQRVSDQLPEIEAERILAEPEGRDTAAAIAWSVHSMPPELQGESLLVLPSDHWIADTPSFQEAVCSAWRAADEHDQVLTFGVPPRWAETGYGYLELVGNQREGTADASAVIPIRRFVEKPDLERARGFLKGGRHLWNAGIFLFRGSTLLRHARDVLPELATGLERIGALPSRQRDSGAREQLRRLYRELPRVSIDYGIMEKLESIHTVILDCGWSDLGSWPALAELLPQLESGSRASGDVVELEGGGNLLYADTGTIATLGVSGLVVVRTADAVLVIPEERSQEVRRIVEELERRGSSHLL